jgi:hypothetical protein
MKKLSCPTALENSGVIFRARLQRWQLQLHRELPRRYWGQGGVMSNRPREVRPYFSSQFFKNSGCKVINQQSFLRLSVNFFDRAARF